MTKVKALLGAFFLLVAFIIAKEASRDPERDHFEWWCMKHGKGNVYDGLEEKMMRFEVFRENLRFVNAQNSKRSGFKLELNKHADMSHDEFKVRYLDLGHKKMADVSTTPFKYDSVTDIPDSIDWRQKNAVIYARDQGSFSTIDAVQGINAIVNDFTVLSELELGCNGGMKDAIDKEEKVCRKNSHAVSIDGVEDVPRNNTAALLKTIAHQPVIVAIDATSRDFMFYKSGIFAGDCGLELNHAVLAVGYGTENGKDYILIKNSWGTDWGERGYMKMERIVNKENDVGKCGINMMASYSIKNDPNPSPPTPHPS